MADAKWVSVDTLKKMIEQNKYHNYGKEYFSTVFEIIQATEVQKYE